MIYPLIHLNGSGANALRDEYLTAEGAVCEAKKKLAMVEFHMRDYYPLGAAAEKQARAEHNDRLFRLETIQQELAAISWDIQRQIDERDAQRR